MLRHDNADLRLREYGYQVGLISKKQYNALLNKKKKIEQYIELFKTKKINPTKQNNQFLRSINSAELKDGITIYNLLKRPEIKIKHIVQLINLKEPNDILEQVEINIKYEGYIGKPIVK